jgi:hypothetical protein
MNPLDGIEKVEEILSSDRRVIMGIFVVCELDGRGSLTTSEDGVENFNGFEKLFQSGAFRVR